MIVYAPGATLVYLNRPSGPGGVSVGTRMLVSGNSASAGVRIICTGTFSGLTMVPSIDPVRTKSTGKSIPPRSSPIETMIVVAWPAIGVPG